MSGAATVGAPSSPPAGPQLALLDLAAERASGYDAVPAEPPTGSDGDRPARGGDDDRAGPADGLDAPAALAALDEAIEAVAALDLDLVDPEGLPELVRRLARSGTRLEALRTRAIAVLERRRAFQADGHRTAKDWLTGELRVDPRKAAADTRLARDLAGLPQLDAAYTAGEISGDHAAVAARELRRAPAGTDRAAFERRSGRYVGRDDGGAQFILELTPGDYELHRSAMQARMTRGPAGLPDDQRRSWQQRVYDAEIEIHRRTLLGRTARPSPARWWSTSPPSRPPTASPRPPPRSASPGPSPPAPPAFCEAHHIRWWDRDHGPTDLDDLLPLCWACHSAVHHTGLRIDRLPDGAVRFTATTGSTLRRAPP